MRHAYLLLGLFVPLLADARPRRQKVTAPLTNADRELLSYTGTEEPWPESKAGVATSLATGPDRATQLDVAEGVLRHLAQHNESAAGRNARAHCVELFGAPASRQFVRRFVGSRPPMRAGCEATQGRVLLRISSIRLLDATHAEASGGYYAGNLSASSHSYWLRRTAEGWTVIGDVLGFIS